MFKNYGKVLPLRYCKKATTNNPTSDTGMRPRTIPKRNGSIISLNKIIYTYYIKYNSIS